LPHSRRHKPQGCGGPIAAVALKLPTIFEVLRTGNMLMKRNLVAAACVVLGVATAILATREGSWLAAAGSVFVVVGCVLAAGGILTLLASVLNNGRTRAALRLDHFFRVLRRDKPGIPRQIAPPLAWLRKCLPGFLLSDRTTKKRGVVRKVLRWLGPSVVAAPVRRISQAVCFLLFLWLFFYTCWPYTAKPAPPGAVSRGWQLQQLEQETGQLKFSGPGFSADTPWKPVVGDTLYLESAGAALAGTEPVAGDASSAAVIQQLQPDGDQVKLTLAPAAELPPAVFDELLLGTGRWNLHQTQPGAWPSHYAQELAAKERYVAADLFLVIDPLVSLSTAVAARSWVWSLACAAMILIVCVLIPRGFCGYLCPLGTLIDLFDWSVTSRVKKFRVPDDGWWVHIKYYLLTGVMLCSVFGVLASGYVAAIPVITRGMLFLGEPLQTGALRGWHLMVPLNAGHFISIGLFFAVLALGFLRPRFWCKYVCPSGAVFSLGNLFRVTERKVESSCINCNKCVEICPFDAIKPDFTTRVSDCTMCQSCGGVCPTHAIKFVERWNVVELKIENEPPTNETRLGRRGFMSLAAGSAAAIAGAGVMTGAAKLTAGAATADGNAFHPVRPPGSVPETEFLDQCIRCGECFKACPNNVLQAMGLNHGLEPLWTPQVQADWAGCASSCNACGQVCPTGAIRPLPLAEKKAARMGLAIVNQETCLPVAGREACQLCVDECHAAGYHAIEFTRMHTQANADGTPVEGSGFLAPVVLEDKCVGCGLCQTRCYGINVKSEKKLNASAIIVAAGPGNEDRLSHGSYIELRRQQEYDRKQELAPPADGGDPFFVPEPDQPVAEPGAADDSPF